MRELTYNEIAFVAGGEASSFSTHGRAPVVNTPTRDGAVRQLNLMTAAAAGIAATGGTAAAVAGAVAVVSAGLSALADMADR
ncbi:MAG: hypothetical protein ACRED4_08245 [Brevundimonas sp.]